MTTALLLLCVLAAPGQRFLVTAYCPCEKCCPASSKGRTAARTPAVGKLAAGPRWMPLGTVVHIPGYGRAVVLDRYAKRLSDRFDVLFPTHRAARAWGARRLMVRIERARR